MIPLLSLFFISALVLVFLLLWLPWTFEVKVEIGRKSYLDYRLVALWGSVSLLPLLNRVSRAIADEIRALLPDEEARHPQDIVERIGELYRHLTKQSSRFTTFMRLFVREILSLEADIALGLADPMVTATLCGGVWAVWGPLLSVLSASSRLKCRPRLSVTPLYNGLDVQLRFHCIFRFRLGQIIGDMMRSLATSAVQRMQVKET